MVIVYSMKLERNLGKDIFNELLSFISSEKRDRIQRFKFYEDAQRCLFGDLLARYGICNRLNIKNSHLNFEINEYGKPLLISPSKLHFNISHSGDWVVCAIDDTPVGIDVEVIKPVDFDIARRFFTLNEYNDLMNKNADERPEYFYTLWTLKESYIKAAGKGLSIPLDSFSFTIENENISLTTENRFNHCFFWKYRIDQRHLAAVCAQNKIFAPEYKCLDISKFFSWFMHI